MVIHPAWYCPLTTEVILFVCLFFILKPEILNLHFHTDHIGPFWGRFKLPFFIHFREFFCDKYSILTYFATFYCFFLYYLKKKKKNCKEMEKRHTFEQLRPFWIIMIIVSFWVSLLETLLLKLSCLIMILLE